MSDLTEDAAQSEEDLAAAWGAEALGEGVEVQPAQPARVLNQAEIDSLLGPGVQREFIHHDIAVETGFDGALCDAMTSAILAADPGARVVPYCLSGGTDAKSFSRLGIRCFGFAPLRLPAELDFFGMFHGVDERVPVDALKFGVRVLDDFLDRC